MSSASGRSLAGEARRRVAAAPGTGVPTLRGVRRELSRSWKDRPAHAVLAAALGLVGDDLVPRWVALELVRHHAEAMESLDVETLRGLGSGMASWGEVDAFGCVLSGELWRRGRVPDGEIRSWASSPNRWWRRAALVSTVPLNQKSRGGEADPARTLDICRRLRGDRDDMVVKAMSWALRALAVRDAAAVEEFLAEPGAPLAARVVREVRNKLDTGLKSPGRAARS